MRPQHQTSLHTRGNTRAISLKSRMRDAVALGTKHVLGNLTEGFRHIGRIAKDIGDVVRGRL
jgi:hypothetical protein